MSIQQWQKSKYANNDQFPYVEMMSLASPDKYHTLYEFAEEAEQHIYQLLKKYDLEYIRYPEEARLFYVDQEDRMTELPKSPDDLKMDIFLLGEILAVFPNSMREKPSGMMFNDFSYLQIELTIAYHLETSKIYILYYTFHYGRMGLDKEKHYFRYDKESDHCYKNEEIFQLPFKPVYHFHGNAKNPHFEDQNMNWFDKAEYIIRTISINLKRLEKEFGVGEFIPN